MIQCRLCSRTPTQVQGVLHRINEKGVVGIWECRPICGAEMNQGDALVAAVTGAFEFTAKDCPNGCDQGNRAVEDSYCAHCGEVLES